VMISRRLDALLIAAGTVTFFALSSYLLKHGLNLNDGVISLLFSLPAALAAVTALLFSSALLPRAGKLILITLMVVMTAGVYAADFFLASAPLAWSSSPAWGFDRSSARARKEIAALAGSLDVQIDPRDRSDYLRAYESRGVDAVPALMLAEILTSDPTLRAWHANGSGEMLPLGGVSETVTVLCNETGQFVTYTSDEHGFRNPSGVWTSMRVDLAALGQSLVQGYCVPNGAGFVDLLRPYYPATLNLGISGQSSLLQLAAIKEYLQHVRPKNVLWFYSEGIDLGDLGDESAQPLLVRYLEPAFSQNLIKRQPQIDSAVRQFQKAQVEHSSRPESSRDIYPLTQRSLDAVKLWHLRDKVDLMFGSNGIDTRTWSKLDFFRETLAQARLVTSRWGGTLYFVYLPHWTRYRNGARVPEREHAAVLKIVNTLQIPVIDIEPAFTSQEDPLSLFPFRRFAHYNEAGNQIVATTVLKALSRGSRDDRDHGEPSPAATSSKPR
jgi:lysophospholipase L1-like esterase